MIVALHRIPRWRGTPPSCSSHLYFSFIDRQIVNLLVEPIKADLLLSDTQISFLQGLALSSPI